MSRPPLAEKLTSAALWGVGLAWMGGVAGSLTLLQSRIPSDRIDPLTRLYTRGQVALTGTRWRAEVDPRVRPDTPYLFVQNHVNLLDHCTAYAATPHFKQGIELKSHHAIPIYGPFMKSRGTLVVDPDDPHSLLSLRAGMRKELQQGHSLIAFPEGTRTRTGEVAPFHSGLFHIARSLKAPIVPIALVGMTRVLRTGENILRPGHDVLVRVLSPMPTEGLANDDVEAFAERVRQRIVDALEAS